MSSSAWPCRRVNSTEASSERGPSSIDARADEIAQAVMAFEPVVELAAVERGLRQHPVIGDDMRTGKLQGILRARIDLAHPRDVFVDGFVDAVDVDPLDARCRPVLVDHGRGAAADQLGGRAQGAGPRDLAETGPVPEIHGLPNKVVFHHRRPLRYPVTSAGIMAHLTMSFHSGTAGCYLATTMSCALASLPDPSRTIALLCSWQLKSAQFVPLRAKRCRGRLSAAPRIRQWRAPPHAPGRYRRAA